MSKSNSYGRQNIPSQLVATPTFCKAIGSWMGNNYNKLRTQAKTSPIRYACDAIAIPSNLLGGATTSLGERMGKKAY